jgi:hypothetical protein
MEADGMVEVLSRLVGWLAGFVREVNLGIAVGYGYEPTEKDVRATHSNSRTRQDGGCRRRKTGKEVHDHR